MEFLYKRYNVETATKAIEKSIAQKKLSVELVDWLLAYAAEHKGKKMTKRIANDMSEAWPNLRIWWEKSDWKECSLTVQHGFINDNDHMRFDLRLGKEKISPDGWREKLNAYWLDRERLPKQQEGLNQVKYLIQRMQVAQEQVKQITEEANAVEIGYLLDK